MKAKILMPLAICIMSFILSCCSESKDPCGKPDVYFYLTETEKKLWPLNENDSFIINSNKGERIVYKGNNITIDYEQELAGTQDCFYYNKYEVISIRYFPKNPNGISCGPFFSRKNDYISINPNHSKNTTFIIPFSYFKPSNYKYDVLTNKGIIKCLAVGDSLYYSQTEGIIRYVENDSVYWTREF